MDRLEAIRVLLRVIETGSFSVPARELNVGQPAVSKTIARLEAELGTRLVGRTTRQVQATAAGLRLVAEVGPLVRALEDSITRLSSGEHALTGTVRIAVAPGFGRACIVPVMRALRVEHPAISIELAVGDRLAELVAENIDIAVRSGTLSASSHVAKRVGETPLLTVGSAHYLARHGDPQEPADIANHDCIVFFTRGTRRAWRYGPATEIAQHPTRAAFCSSNADDIRAAVLADLGLAQVPGWLVARDLADGTLRAVLQPYAPAPIPLFLVKARRRSPERVRVVEQFLRHELARVLVGKIG